jgi:hypothetical protein
VKDGAILMMADVAYGSTIPGSTRKKFATDALRKYTSTQYAATAKTRTATS